MPDRALVFEGESGSLEGVLRVPEGTGPFPGLVMCHPHPQYGGSMQNNVVFAVQKGSVEAGWATLRFNFRGVGRSGGRYDRGDGEQADARAALTWLAGQPEIDPSTLVLGGYSFGATVATKVATGAGVSAVILVAPPIEDEPSDLAPLFGSSIPVLLLCGDHDQYCHVEALRAGAAAIGRRAELHIMARVDHFWGGDEPEIASRVKTFLAGIRAPDGESTAT